MAVIAIDGPAGAGKSTVARLVAQAVGLPYLDTGAMYRCVALETLRMQVDPHDAASVSHIAHEVKIHLSEESVVLNSVDVTSSIRSTDVASIVSIIATHSGVRDAMRQQQRDWIQQHGGGVVEGRDIGTVVFPAADIKIFLTASPLERARRRVQQNGGDIDQVAHSIAERDHIDSTRADSPLRPHEESVLVDSSGKTIDEVVNEIVAIFHKSKG